MCLLLMTTVTTTHTLALRYQTIQSCHTVLSIMLIGTNHIPYAKICAIKIPEILNLRNLMAIVLNVL